MLPLLFETVNKQKKNESFLLIKTNHKVTILIL